MVYSRTPRLARIQIVRERLLRRIDRAPAATVVAGPPGFGKTTLACQWSRSHERLGWRVVWITVDRATEETTFWRLAEVAFAGALNSAPPEGRPGTPAGVAAMLSDYPGPAGWVIDGVSRDLPTRLLDDIFGLVAHTPNLRLLMCADGPAPSILPAQTNLDVDVLPATELAFTREEARRLVEAHDRQLPGDLVALLHREVDGWPLLVSASAAQLPDRPSAAEVRRITRDTASQLFQRYLGAIDPTLAEFSLRASVADRLTPPVAKAITGTENAGRRLDRLADLGVMIRSDAQGEVVYSFAAAVRHALRDWLRRTAPDEYQRLLERLTVAHLDQGERHACDALRVALRSENADLVTKVVEEHWLEIFRADRLLLAEALAAISPKTIASSRALTSARILALGIRVSASDQPLPADPLTLAALGTGPDASEFLLHATATSIAIRRHGEIDQAAERFDRIAFAADAARDQHDPRTLPDLPTVYTQAGFTFLLAGQHSHAQGLLQRAYDLREHHRPGYAGYDSAGKLALAAALEGDLTTASSWLGAGDECERATGRYDGWLAPYIEAPRSIARAACRLEDGHLEAAAADLDGGLGAIGDECELVALRVRALHGQLTGAADRLLADWTMAWHAHTGLLGETETAAAIATASYVDLLMAAGYGTRAGAAMRSCPADAQALEVSAARWALLTGRIDEATYRASGLLWEAGTHRRHRVHLQLISAAAHDRLGRQSEADSLLAQAVTLARRHGLRSPFASADRALLERRSGAVEGLPAILSDLDRRGFAPVFPAQLEVIGLSNREQAVLEALDTGLPVEKIAQRLFVSTNTVKTQMRSLYVKFGTHSRVHTLVKAREHGLLPTRQPLGSTGLRNHRDAPPTGRWEGETAGV